MRSHCQEAPRRIQRRRAKGWRMPEGAVYVGRGSVFGNPFSVRAEWTPNAVVALYRELTVQELMLRQPLAIPSLRGKPLALALTVTKAKRAPYRVEPIKEAEDKVRLVVDALLRRLAEAPDAAAVAGIVAEEKVVTQRAWLADKRPELVPEVDDAVAAALAKHAADFPGAVSNRDGTEKE